MLRCPGVEATATTGSTGHGDLKRQSHGQGVCERFGAADLHAPDRSASEPRSVSGLRIYAQPALRRNWPDTVAAWFVPAMLGLNRSQQADLPPGASGPDLDYGGQTPPYGPIPPTAPRPFHAPTVPQQMPFQTPNLPPQPDYRPPASPTVAPVPPYPAQSPDGPIPPPQPDYRQPRRPWLSRRRPWRSRASPRRRRLTNRLPA